MRKIIYGILLLSLVGTFIVGCEREQMVWKIKTSIVKSINEVSLDYGNVHNAYMTKLALNFKSDNIH